VTRNEEVEEGYQRRCGPRGGGVLECRGGRNGDERGVRDLKSRKEKRMMTIRASHIDIRNMVVREDR
jgi:hypothetical protein